MSADTPTENNPLSPESSHHTSLHLNSHESEPAQPPAVPVMVAPAPDFADTVTNRGVDLPLGSIRNPYNPTLTESGEPRTVHAPEGGTGSISPDRRSLPSVPGFDVILEAGRGGMGLVYKARELALNRIVALKMVIVERHPSAEELIRFRLEAEVAARMRHPNIVQVYESGTLQTCPYLVMEWVEGGTLSDVLKQARLLPPLVAAKLVSILARSVHHAHANGVIHRDLKPGNVMLAPTESFATTRTTHPSLAAGANVTLRVKGESITVTPKVTDFGLAKLTAGDMGLTETGRVMGTPEFMSPEQAAGKIREIGPASDVHALGVMLYQMLVGHTPFRGESTYVVVKRVIEEEPKSIREVSAVTHAPYDLETVCMKCLRKNPAERYESAAALADDLDALLSGRPISARPVGTVERSWKFVKRNPLLASLTASVFFAVMGGFAGVSWQWRKTVAQRNRAVVAEIEAVRQQKTSEAVNRFLVADLIAAAAPDRAQGRTVTVQDALDEASLRLPLAFPDQPEIEAGVQSAIGESYRKLGRPASAEPLLRNALSSRTTILGPDHEDTLRTARELALSLDDAGNWAEAEALLRASVVRATRIYGGEHGVTLDLRSALGLSLQVHGKSDEALSLLAEVVDARIRNTGVDRSETLRAMNDLGLVYYERKNAPEAEKWIAQAFQGREKILGPNHPDTLESANNLAAVWDAEGKSVEAGKLLEELIERSRRVRGANHIDTLSAISNYGRMLYKQKRFAEAAQKYQDAVNAATASPGFGPVHPVTLKYRHNLGTAQFALRRFVEADWTIETVYKIRKDVLPPNHIETLQAGHDLGTLRVLSGRPAQAVDLLAETYRSRKSVNGLTHVDTIQTLTSWGRALLQFPPTGPNLSEVKEAIAEVLSAGMPKTKDLTNLELIANQLSKRETETKSYMNKMQSLADQPGNRFSYAMETANGYVKANELAFALSPALDAVAAAKQQPVSERPLCLKQSWLLAGQVALAAGQYQTAEPILRDLFGELNNSEAESFDSGVAANLLGRCLASRKQFAEAEPFLIQGYENLRKRNKSELTEQQWIERISKAKADLIALYEAWDKPNEVRKWRAVSNAFKP